MSLESLGYRGSVLQQIELCPKVHRTLFCVAARGQSGPLGCGLYGDDGSITVSILR